VGVPWTRLPFRARKRLSDKQTYLNMFEADSFDGEQSSWKAGRGSRG
jgi:hypothetical protein